jgi:hypothetical protein
MLISERAAAHRCTASALAAKVPARVGAVVQLSVRHLQFISLGKEKATPGLLSGPDACLIIIIKLETMKNKHFTSFARGPRTDSAEPSPPLTRSMVGYTAFHLVIALVCSPRLRLASRIGVGIFRLRLGREEPHAVRAGARVIDDRGDRRLLVRGDAAASKVRGSRSSCA